MLPNVVPVNLIGLNVTNDDVDSLIVTTFVVTAVFVIVTETKLAEIVNNCYSIKTSANKKGP